MKTKIPYLKRGDLIQGQIVEVINAHEYLVSVDGDLVRVRNATPMSFKRDDQLVLRVKSVDPLGFQLIDGFSMHLDRLV